MTLLVLCLIALAGGLWRGTIFADRMAVYDGLEGHKVTLLGTVNSDAVYGKNYQLSFEVRDAYVIYPQRLPLTGTLSVNGFGEPSIFKGDRIQVNGVIHRSLGNNVARLSYAQLHVVERKTTLVDSARRKFTAGMQSALPEPVASFGMGLLVGQRSTLPQTVADQLKIVGLTHIIAVSGYNLMIILRATSKLMGKRSKFQYFCLSLLLMSLFLLIAGASPSIVRASVVCIIGLSAWYYGRSVNPFVLVLLSAVITAYVNPLYVWGNISWYLSFLAFFGVLVVSPVVTKRVYRQRRPGLVQAMIIESLCAEVMTLPYVLYIFGQMSTVGLFGNIFVAAFVPLAMLFGLFAGLAGMFMPMVVGWLAWPATFVMTYMLDVTAVLSAIPHAYISDIGFPLWMLVCCYAIAGLCLIVMYYRNRRNYAIITDKTTPI